MFHGSHPVSPPFPSMSMDCAPSPSSLISVVPVNNLLQENPSYREVAHFLDNLHKARLSLEQEIALLNKQQGEFIANIRMHHSVQEFQNYLLGKQREVKTVLENVLNNVSNERSAYVLCSDHLQSLQIFERDFELLERQLELYNRELENVFKEGSAHMFSLVIAEDAIPEVVKKNDIFSVTLRLLCGASSRQHVHHAGPITVANNSKKLHLPSNASLDNNLEAKVALKAIAGSTMKPLTVKFAAQLSVFNPFTSQTEVRSTLSNSSKPFIIISNEVQFKKSVGKLIKKSFPAGNKMTWQHFCNVLNLYFPSATRQKSILSFFHLKYLHETFFSQQPSVTVSDFNTFWETFSACLHTLRYTRRLPLATFFQEGIIFGFISKQDATNILMSLTEDKKYFLIRFSETNPGGFSIVYRSGLDVRHYKLKPGDVLPRLIMEQPHFEYLLQKNNKDFYSCSFTIVQKDDCFKEYLKKSEPSRESNEPSLYSELPV